MVEKSGERYAHPSDGSYFFSKFMVFWIAPLIKLASERQVVEADVWDCPTQDNVEHAHNALRGI